LPHNGYLLGTDPCLRIVLILTPEMSTFDYVSISDLIPTDYPLTVGFVLANSLVFVVELVLLTNGLSESVFEFWFIAQIELTPGLIITSVSHGSIRHFVFNMFLFGMYGRLVEEHLGGGEYATIAVVTAYIPTYAQIVGDQITTGEAGTLGFSGAVYAIIPLYAVMGVSTLVRDGVGESGLAAPRLPFVLGAVIMSLLIPFMITGHLELLSSGLPPAQITHGGGYLIGFVYGLYVELIHR
jgi:membrane associated rhomboid family serine protease